MINTRSAQRGALLIAAIILITVIALLVGVMSFLVGGNVTSSLGHLHSAQALAIAESGLESAFFQYSKNATACAALPAANVNVPVGAGSFTITAATLYNPANTALTAAISASANTIPVASLAGYAPHGRIRIGLEEIDYGGTSTSAAICGTAPCFTAALRGVNGTIAAAHANTTPVFQDEQCLIRSAGTVTASGAQRHIEAGIK